MVDSINTAIRLMCKAHKHGRLGMASDLGMTIDQFHNHLYQDRQKDSCRRSVSIHQQIRINTPGTILKSSWRVGKVVGQRL